LENLICPFLNDKYVYNTVFSWDPDQNTFTVSQSDSSTLSCHFLGAVVLILRQCKPHRNISTLAGSSAVSA